MMQYRAIGGAPNESRAMSQYLNEHKIEIGCGIAIAALVAIIVAGWYS